jgi:hypothetical protein
MVFHHSMIKRETDSNFSIVFSFWARIHRTVRLNIPQNEIVTGVPSYADEKELIISNLLKLSFTKIRRWDTNDRLENDDFGDLKPYR